jgi:S1-C subfamily serine protease
MSYPTETNPPAQPCDLALLTVEDVKFWAADFMPLTVVDVPHLQDAISVAGYPTGGDSLSITSGIVSRLTMSGYPRGWDCDVLSVQIDAAINPVRVT